MTVPALVVFAGRPGTGKTTVSRLVAARLGAAVLRIDAIEAAVVRCGLGQKPVGPIGYVVANDLARGCLTTGLPVVIDAVNPVPEARIGWVELAATVAVTLQVVELVHSDADEHRRRVETRATDLDGLVVPSWAAVAGGAYAPWDEQRDGPRLLLDVAGRTPDQLADAVLAAVHRSEPTPHLR